jgi:hypothetical protein
MSERSGADRVGHGEASLGEAQSRNPHADPDRFPPNRDFDPDTDFTGEGDPPPEERDNEDPAPNAP